MKPTKRRVWKEGRCGVCYRDLVKCGTCREMYCPMDRKYHRRYHNDPRWPMKKVGS